MDLSTVYLGLPLPNPIVASPGPMTRSVDSLKRLEDAGVAAAVLPSLFEEQIRLEQEATHHFSMEGIESFAEATSYLPDLHDYNAGPEHYLETIYKAKQAVSVPVFASLNGHTQGSWVDYARQIEQAGADGLELNIYFMAVDPEMSAAEVEQSYLDVIADVRAAVKMPLAVKVAPYFSSLAHFAKRVAQVGADGMVLFNRFYQPDFDLETLEVEHSLELSDSYASLLPLHWIALLYGRVGLGFAATTGVHRAEDALKLLMAGADVTMTCSALLKHGPGHVKTLLDDLRNWMTEHEYESVSQMKGSLSAGKAADPKAFERVNYIRTLEAYRVAEEV